MIATKRLSARAARNEQRKRARNARAARNASVNGCVTGNALM